VIVFNGNAGNRAYRAPLAAALHRNGFGVFLSDYRGFGGNPGSPSESGLRIDARAVRDSVRARPGVNPDRLVYFGESLGTAVALELAIEHPPAALILRSPFTSLTDVGRVHYPFLPVGLLLRDRYESAGLVRRLRAPLLVIAGGADTIVPVTLSQALYDTAPDPKTLLIISDAEHNDEALFSGRQMIDVITEFLHELDRARAAPAVTEHGHH
jgi:fermentation-respiration switch protein FrsA (DUF1100 family)